VSRSTAGCAGSGLASGVERSGSAVGWDRRGSATGDGVDSAFFSQGGVFGPSSSMVLNVPALIRVVPPSAFSPKKDDI